MNNFIVIIVAALIILATIISMIILIRYLWNLFRLHPGPAPLLLMDQGAMEVGYQETYKSYWHPHFRVLEEYEGRIGEMKREVHHGKEVTTREGLCI